MLEGLTPMHPGELLREEIIPEIGIGKAEMARNLGISRQTLYDILNEEAPVTAQMAVRLGKLCGNGPTIWINLQSAWDIAKAKRELADEIQKIPTLNVA
ncbi:HigA family addiction module antitoxin [Nisaea sp.]|uniref:HigA family addiction module antitoxin n=1 Tax=Nisaea sp. TaxID=2024842 RepID=UPI003297E065